MSEANQQTIAERLNLSRATVSRCFTNHAGISPVTRAKVFQLAAEIGYTHQESRTPSARKKTDQFNFSVLICSEKDEYFHGEYESPGEQILAGVSEYAQIIGARMDVNLISPAVTSIDDPAFGAIDMLKARSNTGVLLIYPFPGPIIDQLSLRLPLVSLVDQPEHDNIDCVDVDHYNGVASVIDHLIAAGHRRIGFYTRDYPIEASWSFRRYSAFIEKMARLKMEVSPNDIIGMFPRPYNGTAQSIQDAISRTNDGVTAWVCAADHQAYDLILRLTKAGLHVPQNVSVTGFDGILKENPGPSLTTVQIPFREIGKIGAQRLKARLGKRFAGKQHIYISGNLLPGETVHTLE